MFAKEGIVGIRRAKKRNMERIAKACGGNSVNAVEDLTENDLGYCETVFILIIKNLSFENTL